MLRLFLSAARKLLPLVMLSIFLTSCTGATHLAPGGQALLLADPKGEVMLLSNWRTPEEKKEVLPLLDSRAYQVLINEGTELLILSQDGSWEIKPSEGGNPEKGNFKGRASLALNNKRDKALVQVEVWAGFEYMIWDLKTNQMESWTPSLPHTFGEQRAVMGYIALEGDLIALVTQGPDNRYHLWSISGSEARHLWELPSLLKPISRLPRPSGGPMGSLLSISPDKKWCVLVAGGIIGMGTPYFIIDLEKGWRFTEFWPEHFSTTPLKSISWSPDSRHLLLSSEMLDGSGRSFLFNLPPTKREQLDELAFWASDDWLLLYHTAPPGSEGVAFPPVEARLHSLTSGEELKVNLSEYTVILDMIPFVPKE